MAGTERGRAPREPVLSFVLWLAAALLSASTVWWGIGPHDEGLMLQAASRIADGQWPYRDFWWNYGPGQPLLLSPFGGSLIAWRVVRIALDATVALLAWRLARRAVLPCHRIPMVKQDSVALLAWFATAAALAWPSTPGPNPAALALSLGALLLAPRRPAAAGAFAGIATLFRPEIGVAAAIGVLLSSDRRKPAAAAAAATTALAWLPFFLVAPADLLDQTVGFLGIQDLQRLPFPLDPEGIGADPNKLVEFYAPLVLVAGAVLVAFARPPLALVPLIVVGVAYLLGRTDEFHLVPLAAVLPIALASARRLRIPALVVVAVIALHGLDRVVTLPREEPAWEARDARILDVIGDRSFFVAPPRFDRVTVGNPLLYVLADARNPTRYDVMQPGVVTTEEAQREMVEDLERARPELLVRWLDPRTAPEDNGSARSSGVTLLDDYLRETYGPARRTGAFAVHDRVQP